MSTTTILKSHIIQGSKTAIMIQLYTFDNDKSKTQWIDIRKAFLVNGKLSPSRSKGISIPVKDAGIVAEFVAKFSGHEIKGHIPKPEKPNSLDVDTQEMPLPSAQEPKDNIGERLARLGRVK